MESKPIILITGFGPFGVHSVNASWESVKKISKQQIEKKYSIEIVCVEIPVVYERVDKLVPDLWKKYAPKLVIHVGVSAQANKITLETTAQKNNYVKLDCDGNLPCNGENQCSNDSTMIIDCGLNAEAICNEYNKKNLTPIACTSTNAGRYLCEYIYYTSLSIDRAKSLFIHVPDVIHTFTAEQIAKGLDAILEICLKQILHCN